MKDCAEHTVSRVGGCVNKRFTGWLVAILPVLLLGVAQANAQTNSAAQEEVAEVPRAPVVLDGETLFLVRGISGLPPETRAAAISGRILAAAEDLKYAGGSLTMIEEHAAVLIEARGRMLMIVTDGDAQAEGVPRQTLAKILATRIDTAIAAYRHARTGDELARGAERAGLALVVFLVGAFVFLWAYRRVEAAAERYSKTRIEKLRVRGVPVTGIERFWITFRGALRFLRAAFLLVASLLAANLILGQFPWTRPFSRSVFGLILDPLSVIGVEMGKALPDVAFLAVLFVVFRYCLRLIRMIFEAIERRSLSFGGFEPEWARPTYSIVRILVVAFGAVVAYPYLPGSSSEAFKGVSLFIGVLISLGSTGVVANILAGYSLTYRRAFTIGDRVKIGDTFGEVKSIYQEVTHVRSPKNEVIILPNSMILNSTVINYTKLAKDRGLILHTTVGIGYETPWRQVEAMLLVAAERTPGVLREPQPFVLQRSLGDFAVNYELNVYSDRPAAQLRTYAVLHRSILDVFNEHGVQIMTPAYMGDPEQAKVVPKEEWFKTPAETGPEARPLETLPED